MDDTVKIIREQSARLQREVRERTVGYLIAAFGFVAGLAWNEAIKALIEYFYPFGNNTVMAKVLYALLVTIVVVVATVSVTRWSQKESDTTR